MAAMLTMVSIAIIRQVAFTTYSSSFRSLVKDCLWPSAEKSGAKIYTHRILAYWPEPEPTLTEWFISALDSLQSFGNGIPPCEEEGESDVIPSAIVNVNFPF